MFFFFCCFLLFFLFPSHSLMLSTNLSSFYIFTKNMCVRSYMRFIRFFFRIYCFMIHYFYPFLIRLQRSFSILFSLSLVLSRLFFRFVSHAHVNKCRFLSFSFASYSSFKQTMRAVKRFIFNVTRFSECLCVHFSVFCSDQKENSSITAYMKNLHRMKIPNWFVNAKTLTHSELIWISTFWS